MKKIKKIYLISTIFNLIMIVVKRNKTIKIINKKCDEKGYYVDNRLIRNIFKYYYYDEEYQEGYIIVECLREWFCFVPIINIIDSIRNIEYLNGNYIHNLRFYNYETSLGNYIKRNMIIKKDKIQTENNITYDNSSIPNRKLTYSRSDGNEKKFKY